MPVETSIRNAEEKEVFAKAMLSVFCFETIEKIVQMEL